MCFFVLGIVSQSLINQGNILTADPINSCEYQEPMSQSLINQGNILTGEKEKKNEEKEKKCRNPL